MEEIFNKNHFICVLLNTVLESGSTPNNQQPFFPKLGMDILLASHPLIAPLNHHKECSFRFKYQFAISYYQSYSVADKAKGQSQRKEMGRRTRFTRFSELSHTLYSKQEDNDNLSKWKCLSRLIAKGNHSSSHCAAELIQSFTFVSFACKF